MQAVILAGGKGTRLKDIARQVPKPMLMIGSKPLMEHQVNLLRDNGIIDIIILVNHLKENITSYFGNGKKWGVSISYFEEPVPLGTVGGIKAIENTIENEFLVLYGDVMVDMDIIRLLNFHHDKKSEATLVLHPNDHPYDSDLVDINENGRIIAFHPKPHLQDRYYRNLVNAGVYVLTPKIFEFIENKNADFGRDIFPVIYNKVSMFGYNTAEYLKDMGTPDRLEKVNADYASGTVKRKSYRNFQKTIFLDRDGVLNPDKDLISKVEDFEIFPYTGRSVRKINESEYLAIVATNQSVVARNLCTEEGLRNIHNKLDTLLGQEHAKLDALYYCPHHPDKGYPGENPDYKIDCDCRKPKPGMLLKAAKEFNIDLSASYFIGDDQRDIEAGQRAGVTTVGLMSGKGLKGSLFQPDYFFEDLEDAVNFIVDDPDRGAFGKISAEFYKSSARPYVILLGGNSRAGKSTLATYLQKSFQRNHESVLRVELDNWVVAKEKRGAGFTVNENFQLGRMSEDLQRMLKGEAIMAPGYARHPSLSAQPIPYHYQGEKVILIEGVVALSDPTLRKLAHLRVFKDVDRKDLEARVRAFYSWKGLSKTEIGALIEKRTKNEYDIIEEHRHLADIVF